ncbi:unnamed protein product [Rotaria magnacalcarata]|uniref:RING-type domain-containing protein n=1 Tax=Rotaria magnacalcarata TaxID=392030 RepID=A0A814T4I8_9BILA|nr:unnamed protein product [Rotaria magnacalcarata]CAF1440289.1 unnamed protein product [Rotaria magnacalcarata]CAF3893899.1 unnamed protein product [Rotaria magnacalcarata]CAF4234450.1 unnamed protein product [Rotaria magnacalcarata]CAF4479104.1 unnamed protein product [Rotaria magnacalcarata]
MDLSNPTVRSYYMEFLRCAACSQGFEYENPSYHPITLPICGHTMCKQCINIMGGQKACPQDQVSFGNTPIDQLPTNYPLLMMIYRPSELPKDHKQRHYQCRSYIELDDEKKSYFNDLEKGFGDISVIIMQMSCIKFLQVASNLGEYISIDFILHYQNHQELKNNLESALGLQQGQFPEPAIQEKILKFIILLIRCSGISSEQHLMYSILQLVERKDQITIQPSVEYIVRLLFGVHCFEIEPIGEFSSIQLKPTFPNYESIRLVYDSKIIENAMEYGCYMTGEQWSVLLYGYETNESIIDPIIDKLLTKTSFQTGIKQYEKIVSSIGAVQGQDLCDLIKHIQFLSNANLAINASGLSVLNSTLDMLKGALNSSNKFKKRS